MLCEDCSFFVDETCTDLEDYIHKGTGLPVCRYNPNAIPRKREATKCVGMEYYSLIYGNKEGDCICSIVKAESHFAAERKANEDVKKWEGFHVYSVNWLDKKRIDGGEVVFCGG